MKLSIVIPVYNTERTIRQCIESILSDSYNDYQIILVDDGSKDSCPTICDEYAKMNQQIHVIHQTNGGLSNARNTGIDVAEGKYITFIDSDDMIQTGTISSLMAIIDRHQEYDMLEYPIYEHYGSNNQYLRSFEEKSYNNMKLYWFHTKAFLHTYFCNKIFKRSIFQNCHFKNGVFFEDFFLLPEILYQCKNAATTCSGLYYYNANENGITRKAGAKEMKDLLNAYIKITGTIFSPIYSPESYLNMLNIQIDVYELTGERPVIPVYKGRCFKAGSKVLLSKLIGIRNICQLNKILHKMYRRSR